jgi:hypothetical protein
MLKTILKVIALASLSIPLGAAAYVALAWIGF